MAITATEFNTIRDLIKQRAAIVIETGKEYLVETRLTPLALQEGYVSLNHFIETLRSQPYGTLHQKVVEAMTTNETSFFRDIHPFETLQKFVLPELFEKRATERKLNIWCAAASTGQEPYTLAMILLEHFGRYLPTWQIRIYATDIARDILAKAKEGQYTQMEVNRGLPTAFLIKYFTNDKNKWFIKPEVKRLVEFGELNLATTWPSFMSPDLVMMRNVLIYFDVPTKRDILARTRKIMRPDGYLFLGGSETTLNIDDAFYPVTPGKTTVYKLQK